MGYTARSPHNVPKATVKGQLNSSSTTEQIFGRYVILGQSALSADLPMDNKVVFCICQVDNVRDFE